MAEGIPIYVKDTFHPLEPGTVVEKNPPRTHGGVVGIAHSEGIALISLEGRSTSTSRTRTAESDSSRPGG